MIDWHCHILPGLDDGPDTMEESVAMARALWQAGFATVCCTPHLIRGCYETSNDEVREAVAALQARLDAHQINLRLLPGREHYLDEFLANCLDDPLPLGDTGLFLVEVPNHTAPDLVKDACSSIKRRGLVPLIAHPERCRLFDLLSPEEGGLQKLLHFFDVTRSHSKLKTQNSKLEEASLLGYLKDQGCGFQGNMGSFVGRYGERIRQAAERLRDAGVYTHYGSDAHVVEHIRGMRMPGTSD